MFSAGLSSFESLVHIGMLLTCLSTSQKCKLQIVFNQI